MVEDPENLFAPQQRLSNAEVMSMIPPNRKFVVRRFHPIICPSVEEVEVIAHYWHIEGTALVFDKINPNPVNHPQAPPVVSTAIRAFDEWLDLEEVPVSVDAQSIVIPPGSVVN